MLNDMSDDERKQLTRIPENIDTRDVLQRLLFNLSLMYPEKFTPDKINRIVKG
jgi:hypothetical protein